MKRRMAKLAVEAKLIGMPVSVAQLQALRPFEFQNWVIQRMNGREAARVKVEKGLEIELVEVSELLKDVPDLVTPTPEAERMYLDLLPQPAPTRHDRPPRNWLQAT